MTQPNNDNALRLIQAADVFRARLAGDLASAHGISVNEYLMLKHLSQAAKTRLPRTELARRMHVSASTITRMAAPMEKIGLVERQADARDARTAYVALSDTGAARLEEAEATFARQADFLFDTAWTEDERAALADLLQRLAQRAPGPLT